MLNDRFPRLFRGSPFVLFAAFCVPRAQPSLASWSAAVLCRFGSPASLPVFRGSNLPSAVLTRFGFQKMGRLHDNVRRPMESVTITSPFDSALNLTDVPHPAKWGKTRPRPPDEK